MSSSRYASIIGCLLCTALLGCAHTPAGDTSGAGTSAPSGAPANAGSAPPAAAQQASRIQNTAAGAPQASAAATPQISNQLLHDALQIGYRPEQRNGVTVFCKEEVPVGTRFGTKQCVGEQDIQLLVQRVQEQRDLLRAQCGGQGCGGPQSH